MRSIDYMHHNPTSGASNLNHSNLDSWARVSGMDFTIQRSPVLYQIPDGNGNGTIAKDASKHVLYRNDSGAPLGHVSSKYKIVQPAEVLEFFQDVCSDLGYSMDTAGVMKNGAAFWALAKTGQSADIAGNGDTVTSYAMLATSCDSSLSTHGMITSIRARCLNALAICMHNATGDVIKVRHNTVFDADSLKRQLGLIDVGADWAEFESELKSLAATNVNDHQARKYFAELLNPKIAEDMAKGIQPDRLPRGFDPLWNTYKRGVGQDGIVGTAYGLVNGVTRYIDHERGSNEDGRRFSAWFAQGAKMKAKALSKALEMVAV